MKGALIIGINTYPSAPLNGCENNALVVNASLENHGDVSPNFDVKLALNVKTKSELNELVITLFESATETALLYFPSHGYSDVLGDGFIVIPHATKKITKAHSDRTMGRKDYIMELEEPKKFINKL